MQSMRLVSHIKPVTHAHAHQQHPDCHIVCHPSCMEGFPNDCGLPAELAAHTLPKHTSSDKPPTQEDREIMQNELDESKISSTNQLFTGQDQVVASTPILEPLPFRATPTVVKSERLALLRYMYIVGVCEDCWQGVRDIEYQLRV